MTHSFIIAEKLTPAKAIWFLGDGLLDNVAPHLENILEKAPETLYITKHYHLTAYTTENKQGYFSNNFLVRIVNSLTTGLNAANILLPSAIVIMLSNSFLKNEYMAEREMPRLLEKLFEEIIDIIRERKRQVHHYFVTDNQPRIIFLRPIPRPAYSLVDGDKYKSVRRKFAQEIEAITYHYRIALVNLDELNCSQRVLFNDYGNLSDYGIEKFWLSLSDYFRRVDRDEYNAIKLFQIPKKTIGTQMYTQEKPQLVQQTSKQLPMQNQAHQQQQSWYPTQHNFQQNSGDYHHNPQPNFVQQNFAQQLPQQSQVHQYPLNDPFHINRK